MSKLHDELKRRASRAVTREDIAEVREWYLKQISGPEGEIYWSELSAYEQRFLDKTIDAYKAWRTEQLRRLN